MLHVGGFRLRLLFMYRIILLRFSYYFVIACLEYGEVDSPVLEFVIGLHKVLNEKISVL